jgi:hypothetical protein
MTPIEKMIAAEIKSQFQKNETENLHSENLVLIASYCGSKLQQNEAEYIQRKHMEFGYLTVGLNAHRTALWNRLKETLKYKQMFSSEEFEYEVG